MSSNKNIELPLKSFSELKGMTFFIPYQQRGYKWTTSNVEELLSDLRDFIDSKDKAKRVYCLQPLAVVGFGGNKYSVLDGQQRLTTLYLLYVYLYNESPYSFEYERDSEDILHRSDYMKSIASADEKTANEKIDYYYIYTAFHHIKKVFHKWAMEYYGGDEESLKQSFKDLLEHSKEEKSLQVIWYEVEKDKQHEIFRNLNSGKINLTNTDLIKALLLNNVSGLPSSERIEAAAIFERMEREMQNDHFWYMINANELRAGQTRMDFLFNIVSGCKQSDYDIDSRWSFRNYFANPEKGSLSEKWKTVRHTFLRLKDMYDDIYSYHYIGFLTYNSNNNPINTIKDLLKLDRQCTHSQFIDKLKERIRPILKNNNHEKITEYRYDTCSKKDLRLLFLMHNIETILQRFAQLHTNSQLCLKKEYEQFPFELLHKQSWDIEHIASNTYPKFDNAADRNDWLQSVKKDLKEYYQKDKYNEIVEACKILEQNYEKSQKVEDFNKLYSAIMSRCDELTDDAIKDVAPDKKDKMQVGNITLLDSHTNRSYHNALFPRKRKYIIVADGLVDNENEFETSLSQLYIPPCTRQVFTKAYNKSSQISLNAWTQTDADCYVRDMEQKLCYYFKDDKKKEQ